MNTAITDCGKHGLEPTETQGGSFLRVGELGSYGVEWSDCSRVTPLGGMAYFGHFLHANGLFDDLVEECPLTYTSNNAPGKRRVLGTLRSSDKFPSGAMKVVELEKEKTFIAVAISGAG